MTTHPNSHDASTAIPTDCWYALAAATDVGRHLLATEVANLPVVLFRTEAGEAVALADRCIHRQYPLSLGTLTGDTIRCGLCGFVYDTTGTCIEVATQPRVPYGAAVAAYPTREVDGLVWVWVGASGASAMHRVPSLPWLNSPEWSTVGGTHEVAAGFELLHESFADATQVTYLAPELAPEGLASPPPLDVTITETTVELSRSIPPAPLPTWQREMTGLTGEYDVTQAATFVSPAVFFDIWDAVDGDKPVARLRFTQLVIPLRAGATRLMWRLSRDFAVGDAAADEQLRQSFGAYYASATAAVAQQQYMNDRFGVGPEVNVAADVAAIRVREIIRRMRLDEGLGGTAAVR